MVAFDELIIDAVLNEAWNYQFLAYPNPTVGACVVKGREILSLAVHTKAGTPHAEVSALKEAYIKLSGDREIKQIVDAAKLHDYLKQNAKMIFHDCEMYVTLEPCNHFGKTPPCSLLLKELKLKRVVYAIDDPNANSSGGAQELQENGIEVKKLYSKKADDLIEPFRIWQKRSFNLFKLALRVDGSIEGSVSSLESRTYAHKIRDVVDMLYIGGNSVRVDRPILDSRLCGGKAPNVTIISNRDDFDRTTPLFDVKNRSVSIKKSIEKRQPSFAMIEGGGRLMDSFGGSIDWFLLFVAPRFGGVLRVDTSIDLEILHASSMGGDSVLFCKPLSHTHI